VCASLYKECRQPGLMVNCERGTKRKSFYPWTRTVSLLFFCDTQHDVKSRTRWGLFHTCTMFVYFADGMIYLLLGQKIFKKRPHTVWKEFQKRKIVSFLGFILKNTTSEKSHDKKISTYKTIYVPDPTHLSWINLSECETEHMCMRQLPHHFPSKY